LRHLGSFADFVATHANLSAGLPEGGSLGLATDHTVVRFPGGQATPPGVFGDDVVAAGFL
jgi:hypothetical protein